MLTRTLLGCDFRTALGGSGRGSATAPTRLGPRCCQRRIAKLVFFEVCPDSQFQTRGDRTRQRADSHAENPRFRREAGRSSITATDNQ